MKKYIPILFILFFCQGLLASSPWLQNPSGNIIEDIRLRSTTVDLIVGNYLSSAVTCGIEGGDEISFGYGSIWRTAIPASSTVQFYVKKPLSWIPIISLVGSSIMESTSDDEKYTWSIPVENSELQISIFPGYAIKLPSPQNGYSFVTTKDDDFKPSDLIIRQGSHFEFKLNLEAGYDQSTPVVQAGSETLTPDADGVYTISDVREDKTIMVTGVNINTYTITLPSPQNGYSLVKPDGNTFDASDLNNIQYDGDFEFKLNLEAGYDQSTPVVKAGTETLTPDADGVYAISDVRENKTITVTGVEKNECTITLPSPQNGYSLVKPDGDPFDPSDLDVKRGNDFQFKLKLEDAYGNSTPEVAAGSGALVPDADGVYTISDVQEDKTITVTGVNINTYTITLPSPQNGYSLVKPDGSPFASSDLEIGYGDDFEFKLNLEAGYSRKDPEVRLSGSALQPDQTTGIYTISDIQKDETLTFYFVPDPVYYSVFLPVVEGAVTDPVAGKYQVEARNNFRFYLTLDEDYNLSEPVVTTDRGETISPRVSDGAYIIENVRQPVKIYIDGVVQNPPPVANAKIEEGRVVVKTEDGVLSISTPEPMRVRIYTFSGSLCKDLGKVNGNVRVALPKGPYIIVTDGRSLKVVL